MRKKLREKLQRGFLLLMAVIGICVFAPKTVKAGTPIEGGASKDAAMEIETDSGQWYTTDGANSADCWFKIKTPKNVEDVYYETDEYTENQLVDEYGHDFRNDYSVSGRKIYFINYNYLEEEAYYYIHFCTTKADNCTFRIKSSTAEATAANRKTIELNRDYSYRYYSAHCYSYYQFVAPTTGKYRISLTSGGDATASVEYKDGSAVNDGSVSAEGGSNSSVFKVTQGMTYYIKAGNAYITSPDVFFDGTDVTFRISNTPVSQIALNQQTLALEREQQYLLEATVLPEDAVDRTVTFSTSNADVATVSDTGWITAIASGTAVITCTANDGSGVSERCTVTVTVPAESIELNTNSVTLNKGKSIQLTAAMVPQEASAEITWTSSNPKVAAVGQDGLVEGKAGGKAVVIATTANGLSDSCTVTVKVPAKSVKLNKKSLTLKKGKTKKLKATVKPADTTDALKWASSNKKVATVNKKGVIRAKGKGTAKITVKTSSGKKTTVKVRVK